MDCALPSIRQLYQGETLGSNTKHLKKGVLGQSSTRVVYGADHGLSPVSKESIEHLVTGHEWRERDSGRLARIARRTILLFAKEA